MIKPEAAIQVLVAIWLPSSVYPVSVVSSRLVHEEADGDRWLLWVVKLLVSVDSAVLPG